MEKVTEQTAPKQRLRYLDWLKLLAAFLVVFYHLAFYDLDYGFTAGQFYLPNVNRVLMSFAACSVPLFFLINGALLFRRHRSWKEMLLKAAKLLVLILVWRPVEFPDWFFRTLIILYLMFPVLQWFKERYPVLLKLGCSAVFIMPFGYNLSLMVLKGLALPGLIPDWTRELTVVGCFTMYSILYFCMGPRLEKMQPWTLNRALLFTVAAWSLTVLECVIYTNSYQKMWDGVNSAFPTVGALLMAAGLFMAFRYVSLPRADRFLNWCCEGILAIYLLHQICLVVLKNLFALESYGIPVALAVTAAACFLSILPQKFCKKIPFLEWFFRI